MTRALTAAMVAIPVAISVVPLPAAAGKKDVAAARNLGLDGQFLLTVGDTGKCLSKVSGDKLGQQLGAWKCRDKSSNQAFKIKWTDGPWFLLRAARGGLCTDVSGGSKRDAKPIVQWSCTAKANQQWKIVGVKKRRFQLQARHSGKCLTLDGANKKVSKFVQRKCGANNAAQRFSVRR